MNNDSKFSIFQAEYLIMNSQITEFSSLKTLPSLSGPAFDAAFEKIYPNLVKILKDEPQGQHQSVIKAFEQFFKYINLHIDDEKWQEVLKTSLNVLLGSFSQNLTRIKNLPDNNNINLIKCILQDNIYILNAFEALIVTLNTVQDLSIEIIPTVPKDIITVMLFAFEFCKNGDSFIINNEEVTRMFKACYSLLCHYFTFLNRLKINCKYEVEFNLLIEVLEKLYEVGAVVISLDLKTMAELWKGFTNILKTYAVFLRKEFDVSKTIRFLIKQITEQVTSMYDNTEEKVLNLTSKISVFLLKIVVKLCEYFEEAYGDCSSDLFEFAIFLYKHSRYFSQFYEVNAVVVRKIDTQLLPGIDPLLIVLINDRQFVNYFLKLDVSRFQNVADKVALLFLSTLILRKLLACTKDVLDLWLNPDMSILHFCFKMIRQFSKELCYDITVDLPCLDVTITRDVYLYDALLINISALIINEISCQKFYIVENLLMSNLLNSDSPLMSLFVSDLWCILARYGNSELCFQHTKFLITLSDKCENPELRVHLKLLIGRLFSFLSSTHQLKIISLLPLNDNFIICYNTLARKFKAEICQKTISESTNKYKSLQVALKQKFEPENHTKIIKLMDLLSNFEAEFLNDFFITSLTNYAVQTWKRLYGQSMAHLTLPDFQSLVATLTYISKITSRIIARFSGSQVMTILQSITHLIHSESLHVKLCCLNILKSLETYQIESHFNEISYSLATCFSSFLKDTDPVVKQSSLDIFTHFSHVTKYENIIALTISKDKCIAENVAAYLQRNSSAPSKFKNFAQFFNILVEKPLPSSPFEQTDSDDILTSAKRIKLQDDLDDKISQIENNVLSLLDYVKHNPLSSQQKEGMRRILNCIEKLQIYI